MNWPFLAIQDPPITPDNFRQTFRPYAIKLQGDSIDSPDGPRVPCEWNMFGSHEVAFVQYQDYTTSVTGGATGYGQRLTADPVIGTTLSIQGDSDSSTPKLVDTNPSSFWSSQIYYGYLQVGSRNYSVKGPRAARMHSRWDQSEPDLLGGSATHSARRFSGVLFAGLHSQYRHHLAERRGRRTGVSVAHGPPGSFSAGRCTGRDGALYGVCEHVLP